MSGAVDMFRCIPTSRVKAFVEKYIEDNYELEKGDQGFLQFSHDSGVHYRRVYAINREEVANLSFDFVDRMLTSLDCVHVWHLSEEMGGFADYYECDEPPAPARSTERQQTLKAEAVVRKRKRRLTHADPVGSN